MYNAGIFKKSTEDYFNGEISEIEQLPGEHTEEDIGKLKQDMQDILKISIPIFLQNVALENVGTTKLKSIIEGVIKDKNSNDFSKFFSVFLFSDLHLPGLKQVLKEYITGITNKSLLTIIFFKLLYYYISAKIFSKKGSSEELKYLNLYIKLYGKNKWHKDRIISDLKKQKLLENS